MEGFLVVLAELHVFSGGFQLRAIFPPIRLDRSINNFFKLFLLNEPLECLPLKTIKPINHHDNITGLLSLHIIRQQLYVVDILRSALLEQFDDEIYQQFGECGFEILQSDEFGESSQDYHEVEVVLTTHQFVRTQLADRVVVYKVDHVFNHLRVRADLFIVADGHRPEFFEFLLVGLGLVEHS